MTVDPSALQAARLALATLTLTWPMLAAAADTTLTRRAPATAVRYEPTERCSTHMEDADPTPGCRRCRDAQRSHDRWTANLERRDAQLRDEREDRDRAERFWALPSTKPPADLDVLDVRTSVLQAMHTSVLLARSDLAPWAGHDGLVDIPGGPPRHITARTVGTASVWLANVLEYLDSAAAAIAGELTPAGRDVHQVLQLDPDELWRPMGTARCPACRQRSLYRWTASGDRRAWTRECRAQLTDGPDLRSVPCLCRGATCPCGRPAARSGSRHLWPA